MRLAGLAPGFAAHSVRKKLSLHRPMDIFLAVFLLSTSTSSSSCSVSPLTIAVQDSSEHLVQMPSAAQKSLIPQNPEKPTFQNTRH
jgi:hypothetical protein